jgi:hypothetical protein
MDALERFELIGEMFRKDTGLFRPGKRYPSGMTPPENLQALFLDWISQHKGYVDAIKNSKSHLPAPNASFRAGFDASRKGKKLRAALVRHTVYVAKCCDVVAHVERAAR